ncbi:MAG: HAMP domain-containing sensor histidine kinase [Myxococcota bacterium]
MGLSPALFDQAFPFHLVVDERDRVVQCGPSLLEVCPAVRVGASLGDVVTLRRPAVAPTYEALRALRGQLCFVRVTSHPIELRGQWLVQGERIVFVGSPVVTRLDELLESGLKLAHFAVHDPVADYLFLLHSRDMTLADVRTLQERVARRNTELESAEADLRRQQVVAAEALQQSQEKSSFLTSMSHELRTPLNAIVGYAELLLDSDQTPSAPPVRADQPVPDGELQRILFAARQLESLIDDVLDLAKVEAGRMDVHPEPVDLVELLDGLSSTVQPMADRVKTTLVFEPADVTLITDRRKVHQIVLNLVANAIRATRGGEVRVRVVPAGARVVFEVVDTGVGMAPETVGRLFRPFVQGDETGRRGGTGLGLTISRLLARLLGGDVSVESELGKGSTFRLTLPRDASTPDPDGVAR